MTLELIDEEVRSWARQERACAVLGLSVPTVQRWRRNGGGYRRSGPRSALPNALTPAEHLHSALRFVTPDDRHFGREPEILERRSHVYDLARSQKPESAGAGELATGSSWKPSTSTRKRRRPSRAVKLLHETGPCANYLDIYRLQGGFCGLLGPHASSLGHQGRRQVAALGAEALH